MKRKSTNPDQDEYIPKARRPDWNKPVKGFSLTAGPLEALAEAIEFVEADKAKEIAYGK